MGSGRAYMVYVSAEHSFSIIIIVVVFVAVVGIIIINEYDKSVIKS